MPVSDIDGQTKVKREQMVEQQIIARGLRDEAVLRAMREVPREAFLPEDLREFAYLDVALPILEGQTISQPYIVALMAEALQLSPEDKVLEIGTGCGYAAAVLSRVAREVYTVERHAALAEYARKRLKELGYTNVHVRHGDGTLGWPEHAPYDAMSVAASGPEIPQALREQLRVGGRLVIPVGDTPETQQLVRITRVSDTEYRNDDLGPVRFVPLIGEQGWNDQEGDERKDPRSSDAPSAATVLPPRVSLIASVREAAQPFGAVENADLQQLMGRIAASKVVLIGEATHGTSEFYRMRARITQELISNHGFTVVAAEADWPDARRIDDYVRHVESGPRSAAQIFSRFPLWMWRNLEVLEFVEWLREHNADQPEEKRAGFYGLDLYSLYTSINEVLGYLDKIDPATARVARLRYGCLTPFEHDPATYGLAALTGQYQNCEADVTRMLADLLQKRMEYEVQDGEGFFDAAQNARIAANAEKFYRAMYYGSAESWNLRDQHMFETLEALLSYWGPDTRAVVWAHNSHVGNASATEMAARGELNIGKLSRDRFGEAAYLIGFGTDHGTVAAAHNWGEDVQIMQVRPSHPDSYERLCHETGISAFLLPLRWLQHQGVREGLQDFGLERAIGVIYRPETELMSHYFQANLPEQFDEYIWLDETTSITPLGRPHLPRLPEKHPFALLDE